MRRYVWSSQHGGFVEVEDDHGQNVRYAEVQPHSMDIQQTVYTEKTQMEFASQWSSPYGQDSSSPEMPVKKKKKKEKRDKGVRTDSPSNSPKGRGRYACLLHRQKHKRCPPDCPERKPKLSTSPPTKRVSTSTRKSKVVQINPIDLGFGASESLTMGDSFTAINPPPSGLPASRHFADATAAEVPKMTWDNHPVTWEDLSWNELNNPSNVLLGAAWEDLHSSTHWEVSKQFADPVPKSNEFDTNQFLMDEKRLQLSDSPEGGVMSDVRMTEF